MTSSANVIYKGFIKMPYRWFAGDTGSRFLTQLKDYKKIWGTKCSACGTVYMPPRNSCIRCFVPINDWIELKPEGVLVTYTVVHYHEPAIQPYSPPVIYGIVKLDGADTGFLHLISGIEPDKVCSGMRVRAVFSEERKGSPLDIKYFEAAVQG